MLALIQSVISCLIGQSFPTGLVELLQTGRDSRQCVAGIALPLAVPQFGLSILFPGASKLGLHLPTTMKKKPRFSVNPLALLRLARVEIERLVITISFFCFWCLLVVFPFLPAFLVLGGVL